MLGAQSEMGVQLDSLCDAIGFGIGPAFVTYSVAQQGANRLMSTVAWFAAMVYAAAIVLRLARFNTLLEDENRPLFHKEFFVGVPAPAAAWLALTPVVAHQAFGEGFWSSSWFCSAWLVFIGVLAFSRIPTYSFKKWLLTRRQTAFLLFGAALAIAGLFTWPYIDMLAILVLYVATIPFAIRRYRWLLAHPQAWDEIGYKIPKRSRRAGVKPRARRWRQV
jgi:CDP-diacylglycerol--serine O-phosphatidyltransferase